MNKYYFTFGCDDPVNKCKYLVIEASSYNEARSKMFEMFGNKWALCYSEEDWIITPSQDKNWKYKARIHGLDPNRTEPITQAELYNLTELRF